MDATMASPLTNTTVKMSHFLSITIGLPNTPLANPFPIFWLPA
jgi:hypothetical protein